MASWGFGDAEWSPHLFTGTQQKSLHVSFKHLLKKNRVKWEEGKTFYMVKDSTDIPPLLYVVLFPSWKQMRIFPFRV